MHLQKGCRAYVILLLYCITDDGEYGKDIVEKEAEEKNPAAAKEEQEEAKE